MKLLDELRVEVLKESQLDCCRNSKWNSWKYKTDGAAGEISGGKTEQQNQPPQISDKTIEVGIFAAQLWIVDH